MSLTILRATVGAPYKTDKERGNDMPSNYQLTVRIEEIQPEDNFVIDVPFETSIMTLSDYDKALLVAQAIQAFTTALYELTDVPSGS